MAAGLLVRSKGGFPGSAPVLYVIGNSVYLITLFVLSFFHHGKALFTIQFEQFPTAIYFFCFATAALGSLVLAFWAEFQRPKNEPVIFRIDCFGVLIVLLLVVLNTLGVLGLKGWAGAAVFNLVFLFHSILLIVTGCRKLDLKSTTAGCLLVACISLARYTDLFVSLLARSSVFLLLGAALFAVGFYYSRTKKQLQEKAT
jgi:hypothetical protein